LVCVTTLFFFVAASAAGAAARAIMAMTVAPQTDAHSFKFMTPSLPDPVQHPNAWRGPV
jgi:hypothetical protein